MGVMTGMKIFRNKIVERNLQILMQWLVSGFLSDLQIAKKKEQTHPFHSRRKLRSLLVTVENNALPEDLSKYVGINITVLSQDEKTKALYMCPVWEAVL